MIARLKTYRIGAGVVSILLMLIVFLFIGWMTPTYDKCKSKYAKQQTNQALNQPNEGTTVGSLPWRFATCEFEAAEANHGVITAFATVAIAGFTLTLWLVAGSQLRHTREIERAYVSGGGSREVVREIHQSTPINLPDGSISSPLPDGTFLVLRPTGRFRIDANNHGKTRAFIREIQHGFCDAAQAPPLPIPYGARRPLTDVLGPGIQSRPMETVPIPQGQFTRTAIFGRIYWRDIRERDWSSGFIYEIPSGSVLENNSISILAPEEYWKDRDKN